MGRATHRDSTSAQNLVDQAVTLTVDQNWLEADK